MDREVNLMDIKFSPERIAKEKLYLEMGISETEFGKVQDFLGRLPITQKLAFLV